jgi:hypothetical protein
VEILLRRDFGPVLRPCDEVGERALKQITQGNTVTCQVKQPRNVLHHRKFFALMSKVFENQEYFTSIEQLVAALKIAIGHVDVVQTRRGTFTIPKSISFAKMDQAQFSEFYERAVDFVVSDVVPGLGRAELEAEIQEMIR